MRIGRGSLTLLALLIAPIVNVGPVLAATNSRTAELAEDMTQGVEVAFWNNTANDAQYVSSKYSARLVWENDVLGFAVFRPTDDAKFLDSLREESLVRSAVPEGSGKLEACPQSPRQTGLPCGGGGGGGGGSFPNDPSYSSQWGPHDLNLDQAWFVTTGTRNRIVAIVDTGVWLNHPDLVANLWTSPMDGSHGWNVIGNNNDPSDEIGHGTLVAGVAGAVINNGIGVAGTANEKIMAVKVCYWIGHGTPPYACPPSSVATGIQWAVDHGANVINLSLEIPDTPGMQSAVAYAWSHGAIIVGSSGNNGASPVVCPACYNEVIAVGALINSADIPWQFSNYGSKIELSAPGSFILTTCWPNAPLYSCSALGGTNGFPYWYADGTSLAAPFVSGIAALLWDYLIQTGRTNFSNQNVRDALDSYTVFLGSDSGGGGPVGSLSYSHKWNQNTGYGKPDALALLTSPNVAQSYLLTAQWYDCYFLVCSSGPDGGASVWVFDVTTGQSLLNGVQVGSSGQTVNILPGHSVRTDFGTNEGGGRWLYAMTSKGGGLTYNSAHDLACKTDLFTFPLIQATSQGQYTGTVGSNPWPVTCGGPLPN